jgi:DNA polymerase III delta prime subunit
MTLKNKLWVEKYKPLKLEDYVFNNDQQKSLVTSWVESGNIPNLILSGEPGVGKTALSHVLINELGINTYDLLEINASRENGVDVIREKILSFVQTIPFGSFKIVLLDEADYLTPNSQAMLRNDMETYYSTVRFILTCNYQYRIIPALKSRCHTIEISKTDKVDFTVKMATILVNENIEFELHELDHYVESTYPDLRKCINQLQVNSLNNKLVVSVTATEDDTILSEAADLFKSNQIIAGRKKVLEYLSLYPSRGEDIYKWAYNNLDMWANSQEKKDACILHIRNGLVNLNFVAIPEIAICASLIELTS